MLFFLEESELFSRKNNIKCALCKADGRIYRYQLTYVCVCFEYDVTILGVVVLNSGDFEVGMRGKKLHISSPLPHTPHAYISRPNYLAILVHRFP